MAQHGKATTQNDKTIALFDSQPNEIVILVRKMKESLYKKLVLSYDI